MKKKKKAILEIFKSFLIAPLMPSQWHHKRFPPLSATKAASAQYHTVKMETSSWERDEDIQEWQAWLQTNSSSFAPFCTSSATRGVRSRLPGGSHCVRPAPSQGTELGGSETPLPTSTISPQLWRPPAPEGHRPTALCVHRSDPPRSHSSNHTIHHLIKKLRKCQWCNSFLLIFRDEISGTHSSKQRMGSVPVQQRINVINSVIPRALIV